MTNFVPRVSHLIALPERGGRKNQRPWERGCAVTICPSAGNTLKWTFLKILVLKPYSNFLGVFFLFGNAY